MGFAIPGAMLADEQPFCERCGQAAADGIAQPQRCRVRAEGIVGHQCLGDLGWIARADTLIQMLTVVAPWPAIEAAILD